VKRVALESSVLASAGYDPDIAVLELEFRSGEVYRYFAVPPSVNAGLLAAPSAGRFFTQRIRDRYSTRRS